MPSTIATTVYTFDELSDTAKETAREWYRQVVAEDFASFNATSMEDDFMECARLLGITFASTRDGGPDIRWSGFSSQGDGASYVGHYRYAYHTPLAIREHAPKDTELHRIADGLAAIQRPAFYGLTASISGGTSRYSHSQTMEIEVEHATSRDVSLATIDTLSELLRDFADWIYKSLEAEWDYTQSNEYVDEGIMANEYTFTETGRRFG